MWGPIYTLADVIYLYEAELPGSSQMTANLASKQKMSLSRLKG